MRIVQDRVTLRQVLGSAAPGLVPTMGALHGGHLALIRRSATENDRTVVSVFVNPTQFDDPADLARYPRDPSRDVALAAEAGADIVFAPLPAEIYPPGFATTVKVGGPSTRWEGAARPGHLQGVATVVTILLNLVRPARTYFGEKDFQQLQVVRRLHADLALPGEIAGCETVRDPDGLAMSSRNARFSPGERRQAVVVPRALRRMVDLAAAGEPGTARLIAAGQAELAAEPAVAVEYLAVVDPTTLEPLTAIARGARVIVAVHLGGVRLIDNVALLPGE